LNEDDVDVILTFISNEDVQYTRTVSSSVTSAELEIYIWFFSMELLVMALNKDTDRCQHPSFPAARDDASSAVHARSCTRPSCVVCMVH